MNAPTPLTGKHFCIATPSQAITLPVGTIFIAGHGDNRGHLIVAMDSPALGEVQFEALVQRIIPDGKTTIPSAFTSGAGLVRPRIRFISCRIGASRKFSDALAKAFHNPALDVVVPKHFEGFGGGQAGDTRISGRVENLNYWFEMSRPCPLPDRDTIIAEFDKEATAAFASLQNDNTPDPFNKLAWRTWKSFRGPSISLDKWRQWVPKDAPLSSEDPSKPKTVPVTLDVSFGANTIEGHSHLEATWGEFWRNFEQHGYFNCPGGDSKKEADAATRKAHAKACLSNEPKFRSEFPFWERQGFESMDHFIESFDWTARGYISCPQLKRTKEAIDGDWWIGRRHLYVCVVPITDASDALIFNYTGPPPFAPHFGLDGQLNNRLLYRVIPGF
jgi:hypothetical protein